MYATVPGDYKPAPVLEKGEAGLRQLAELLEHQQAWRDRWEWDFGLIINGKDDEHPAPCGTAGCALGLAIVTWPRQFAGLDPLYDVAMLLDGNFSDWFIDTFLQNTYGAEGDWSAVTPGMVAARIRERVGY